jgi:putative transposase
MSHAPPVVLPPEQRRILERLARSRTLERRSAERVQIVLGCADGKTNVAIAKTLGVDPQRVARWRGRFIKDQQKLAAATTEAEQESVLLDLLGDRWRSGCPGKFTLEQLSALIALACEDPKDHGAPVTHWTPRELAICAQQKGIVASISPRHVARFFPGGRAQAAPIAVLAQPQDRRPAGARSRRRERLRALRTSPDAARAGHDRGVLR